MLLADVVTTSAEVAATRSRKAKVAALTACLTAADPTDLEVVTAFLAGSLLQRRTGLGWRGVARMPPPADTATLTVLEVDRAFERLAALSGAGSQSARSAAVDDLFGRATGAEQDWLRGVVTGSVRQGALDALVQEAVAAAAEVPLPLVRRAAMLAGGTVPVVRAAFEGGAEALSEVGLTVGRPVLPMLASSAPDVTAALAKAGGDQVALDVKLDGIRIQVHRHGDEVRVATRSLDDITDRLPEVIALARSLPATTFVLDGEAIALDDERAAARVPGDRLPHRPGLRRGRHAVLLRPPPPRPAATSSTPPPPSGSPRSTGSSPRPTGCPASSPAAPRWPRSS